MVLIYLIVGIVAGLFAGKVAKKKEQNPAIWFVVCFLLPIALIGLFLLDDVEAQQEVSNV
jgi:uncharacterized membrane protein YeaQ/YmgE (transglycosylase-associated protein family)